MLEVTGLAVSYGGIRAVKGITFHVNAGELVALIGANGAGKTSTLKALARQLPAVGSLRYEGRELAELAPHQLIGAGIALVPEGRGVFARLTVEENLDMGAYSLTGRAGRQAVAQGLERAYALMPRLKERRRQLAGTLSGGEQQMLAIARALMGEPRLLLLDEPSMGLAPLMVQKVFEVIREVRAAGVTVLLVEQNARLALQAADRGYVLESGELAFTDDAPRLLADPRVQAAYLGE
ncbi:branched-chain amino acid ABC transporter ATP-binding protein [Oryzomicrobium terrae]|uniref:Branched-chain amino acid ABC transporter ATP-binding protein n=1 Tax=Oryzomicrobium terrae TaxID=1735038 RepID=A0A5C1EBM4_9RHOO|nr:ABC transporter ATP-binding protein [Oryzomicrobium terrae]QEL66401.1 branched-chain amino acid ABC transporter ATP-binding protein [Oryzomicrobium terrae]